MEKTDLSVVVTKYMNKINDKRRSNKLNGHVIAQRIHKDSKSVHGILNGEVSSPNNETLRLLAKLFIEDGGITTVDEAKEIWIAAARESQFDEAGIKEELKKAAQQGMPVYSEERLRRVLTTNARGVNLLDAIESLGLSDIEERTDKLKPLPPEQLYDQAEREIALAGPSLYRTFDTDIKVVEKYLSSGRQLYTLVLHPNSPDVDRLSDIENHLIRPDLMNVIEKVKRLRPQYKNFHIRFMPTLPPFIGVMVDGDVEPRGNPIEINGQIRIQIRAEYQTLHEGVVVQFRKMANSVTRAFNYYAADMRKQWEKGIELDKVLEDLNL